MASIQKHGSKFYITVSMGFDVNGKRLRYTITYQPELNTLTNKAKKALEKYAAEFEEKVVNGISMDGNKITFKDFAEKWLDNVAKRSLEESTFSKHQYYLDTKIYPRLGHLRLDMIKPNTIVQFYEDLIKDGYIRKDKRCEYQSKTLKRIQSILNSIFKTAVKWEIMERNPCEIAGPPKVNNGTDRTKCFNEQQIHLFLEALEQEYRAYFPPQNRYR